jgi:hypothetical protein
MAVNVTIDQFDDDEIRQEYNHRFSLLEEEPVDLEEVEDGDLIDELKKRDYYFRHPDSLNASDIAEILKDRSLSIDEQIELAEAIGVDEGTECPSKEEFIGMAFDTLEDQMKMEVFMENMNRFSLEEIRSFFEQSFQRVA